MKVKKKKLCSKNKSGLYYNGNFLLLSYEELVDLFSHYRDSGMGETLSRKKCETVFGSLLPITDY